MSAKAKTVQFRAGFRTITPYIVNHPVDDLIEFVKQVFGAEETGRSSHQSGGIHAEFRIGDCMMMIGGAAVAGPRTTIAARVYVKNSDEAYRRALELGAVSTLPMTDNFGEHFGCVNDPFGNQWIISTQTGPHYLPGSERSITPFLYARDAAKYIDFLKQALGAEELMRAAGPDGTIKHALLKIGDSVIATSEASEQAPVRPMLYLYVPDCDALYDQALSAGATSIHPPTDHSYGDRGAGVTDPWGNQWYMATPL
jgi:PhnB protein